MEDAHLAKEDNGNPAPFAFCHLRTQLGEQRLNIAPLNVAATRMRKDQLKGALVLSLHNIMVPPSDTEQLASAAAHGDALFTWASETAHRAC